MLRKFRQVRPAGSKLPLNDEISAMQLYSRRRVLALLKLKESRLRSWERRGLLPRQQAYSLSDLGTLRQLLRLSRHGLRLTRDLALLLRQRWVGCSQGQPLVRDQAGLVELHSGQGILDFAAPAEVVNLAAEACDPVELLNQGRAADALALLEEARRRQPWSVETRFNLALAREQLGQREEALEELAGALALCPGHAGSHYNRARLCELTGRLREARHHWQCFLKLQPDGPSAEEVRRFLWGRRPFRPCP